MTSMSACASTTKRSPSATTPWSSAMRTLIAMSAGDTHDDPRPAAGRGPDLESAPDRLCALPHCHHAQSGPAPGNRAGRRFEAYAVVRHRYDELRVRALERDAHVAGMSVLRDVVERLLHDAEQGNFARLRHALYPLVAVHRYLDAGAVGECVGIPLQCRQQAVIIEHGGSKLRHYVFNGAGGGFEQSGRVIEPRTKLVVSVACEPRLQDVETDAERREVLPHPVVQLPGELTPLRLLHVHQPSRQRLELPGGRPQFLLALAQVFGDFRGYLHRPGVRGRQGIEHAAEERAREQSSRQDEPREESVH